MKKYFCLIVLCTMVLVSKVSAQETARQYALQANQLYQAQNYAQAEKLLQSALALDSSYAPAHQLLGNVYMAQGQKAQAMTEYKLALSFQPDNPALKAYVQAQQPPEVSSAPTPVPSSGPDLDKAHAMFGLFGGAAFWGGIANEDESYDYETTNFDTAVGGGFYVGCQFDRHFSVALNLTEYSFPITYSFAGMPLVESGVSESLQEWQLMMVSRYIMGSSGVRPYISLGLGTNLSLSVTSESGYSSIYASTVPVFQFGVGTIIPLSREWDIFLEANYYLGVYVEDNEDESFSFIPINLGVQYNLP